MSKESFVSYIRSADSDFGIGGGERHASVVMAFSSIGDGKDTSGRCWLNDAIIAAPPKQAGRDFDERLTPLGWIAKEVGLHGKSDLASLTNELVRKGADPNAVAWDGFSPLELALSLTCPESVFSKGAFSNVLDKDSKRLGNEEKTGKFDQNLVKWLDCMTANGAEVKDELPTGMATFMLAFHSKGGKKTITDWLVKNDVSAHPGRNDSSDRPWFQWLREASVASTKAEFNDLVCILDGLVKAPCDLDAENGSSTTLRSKIRTAAGDLEAKGGRPAELGRAAMELISAADARRLMDKLGERQPSRGDKTNL